jgi:putative transposase
MGGSFPELSRCANIAHAGVSPCPGLGLVSVDGRPTETQVPRALRELDVRRTFVPEAAEVTNATTTTVVIEWDANSATSDHPQEAVCFSPTLPLCASYFSVIINRLDVRVQGDSGRAVHCAQWAVGLLPDGELEMLGAWSAPGEDTRAGRQILEDLKVRGVEAVRFVISPDPAVTRVDAVPAYPRGRVLLSVEASLRESLLEVAPSHRRVVGQALRLLIAAESLESAAVALDAFAASSLGARYPAVVDRWQRALVEFEPVFALGSRQRRMLLLADRLVRDIHERVRRSLSRPGTLPSSARVSSLVEASLARIGHRLPTHKATLGSDVVGYSVRPVAGSLAASP